MKRVNALRAQRFIVRVHDGATVRKLFTFGFRPSDGSIWAAVPYFQHSKALLSELTMAAEQRESVDLSLATAGKVTTHKVKFSHHRSGECLFSLTGKVKSIIRRQSVPLGGIEGHIVTIQLEGLYAFREDQSGRADASWEEPRRERTITFNEPSANAESMKFVLWAYAKRFLRQRMGGREIGPPANVKTPEGPARQGMIVAPPAGTPGASTMVLLTAQGGQRLSKSPGASLSLIGGFDPVSISRDIAKPTSFLAMLSPPENYEELLKSIGTIDLGPAI